MIFDYAWADALLITGCVLIVPVPIYFIVKAKAKRTYYNWLANPSTPLDVDSFVDTAKNPPKYLKIAFLQRMSVGDRTPDEGVVKLASAESTHVPGLQVTERAELRPDSKLKLTPGAKPVDWSVSTSTSASAEKKQPLVIGTIRMGFGHHRIAYAACEWAMNVDNDNDEVNSTKSNDRTTYFHDLLNIDSPEADLIKSTDAVYSKMSRLTSNIGGFVETLWGKAMLSGDGDALRISGLTATHLRPLFKDLPLDTPIIATHCYVALAAVSAGFTNVINLVIDNHAQWFVVVPGCLNLVQGPVNYQNFLKMGVQPENIQLAGHWIPRDLVLNIPSDCERRIQRAHSKSFQPRRILIPVGGAGAQRKFIVKFVRSLKPLIDANKVQLFLNAGDHKHMKAAFQSVLSEIGLDGKYDNVNTTAGVHEFRDELLKGKEPKSQVTLFSFDDYFPAVATTDILSRVADILACKPSELAFYPVPKLMIRRVGDHEQYSALRAAELGDGTLEAREIEDCETYMDLFVNGPELLESMNRSIVRNNTEGVYDGCKNAVRIALERAAALK